MSFATGHAWLHHSRRYRERFSEPVPDWVCMFDMPVRREMAALALKLDWRLPQAVLVRDEFHTGPWSVWGG